MFHSDEERNRNVDLLNELQQSDDSTKKRSDPNGIFELGQSTSFDIETFDFDLDDGECRTQWGDVKPATHLVVDERQHFTTFTPEDRWPI